MSFDLERLYTMLPAFYRISDAKQGSPLKSLLSVIAEQIAVVEEDLDQLYDDQFIETCAEWVVQYIGDLVGTRGLSELPDAPFSRRAQVANTLAYRRRKGTAAVIEQLARDVTAWDANVVEYFQLLATTQYMNHIRSGNKSMTSLRDWELLERLNTPFDKTVRTIDVRRIEKRRGKYNIPNIGVYLWRLGSYPLTGAPAFKVDNQRYLFDALGKNSALYTKPEIEKVITHLAEPINVPMPISRRILDKYLDTYYGIGKSILLNIDGQNVLPFEASLPITSPPSDKLSDLINVCNLSDLVDAGGNVIGWSHMPVDKIAIDPVLGRIALPEDTNSPPEEHNVKVTYHYGFSKDIGGGEYGRSKTFSSEPGPVIKVPSDKATIQEALNDLDLTGSGGTVEIEDNEYYLETPIINVPEGKTIELRAADKHRPILVLENDLEITGGENSMAVINGLLISGGRLSVPLTDGSNNDNRLQELCVRHCTLLPGPSPAIDTVLAQPAIPRMLIELPNTIVKVDKSIVGGMRAVEGAKVHITNSILDATEDTEIAYAGLLGEEQGSPPQEFPQTGALLKVENSTIIGKVYTIMFKLASNTIFLANLKEFDVWMAPVMAERLQQGCVRFSYLPPGSKVPHPYRCQPDLAFAKRAKELGLDSAAYLSIEEKVSIAARLRPVFTSERYGDAGYCQLNPHGAIEFWQGADDEAEMGAFHDLFQPQRVGNLRAGLDEYLRFGLEAGTFYAT